MEKQRGVAIRGVIQQLQSPIGKSTEVHWAVSDPNVQCRVLILNHFEYFLSHVAAMKIVSHEAAMLRGEYELRVAEIKRQY